MDESLSEPELLPGAGTPEDADDASKQDVSVSSSALQEPVDTATRLPEESVELQNTEVQSELEPFANLERSAADQEAEPANQSQDLETTSNLDNHMLEGTDVVTVQASRGNSIHKPKTAQTTSKRQCLRFHSWWYEDKESSDLTLRVSSQSEAGGGLRRYYCTLTFDSKSQTFSVKLESGEQGRLMLDNLHNVTDVHGRPVDVWDLHVGMSLILLGRKVTLLKADAYTAAWIDMHAARLKKLKDELLVSLDSIIPFLSS